MKNKTTHIGKISKIERIDTSIYGNPRYQFVIDGYTAKTGVDSMHGYSITNYDDKLVKATLGTHYNTTTLDSIKLIED